MEQTIEQSRELERHCDEAFVDGFMRAWEADELRRRERFEAAKAREYDRWLINEA